MPGKVSLLALTIVLLGSFSSVSGKTTSREIISAEATAAILKQWETIKPGVSTRADVLKIFSVTGGGVGDAGMRTYGYRDCPQILVDVTFAIAWSRRPGDEKRSEAARLREQWEGRPADKLVTISKPYLGFLAMD